MIWTYLALAGAGIWTGLLLLPWRPWSTRECLDAVAPHAPADLAGVTVLIPARNEARVIAGTLDSLRSQGKNLKIILVDDQSTDGTVRIARQSALPHLQIITGVSPPPGWSGKLWALEQGWHHIRTPLTLLMDADIAIGPGTLAMLVKAMERDRRQLVSLMVSLRMVSFWERLLLPAFIYFFKLIYPFRLSNSKFTGVAAAAGGCILLKTRLLEEIGGFNTLRGELIDDCALARRIKSRGDRIWIGLTHSVHSLRAYNHLAPIWDMVARTAFTQLHYSVGLLMLVSVLMGLMFWLPLVGLWFPSPTARLLSLAALGMMMASYIPTLKFYDRSIGWALALPLIASLYLAMTWTSAFRFWKGAGARWKGRYYTGK